MKKTSPLTKTPPKPIKLIGAKQNNLKNITVEFPAKKITVITGLSGSGKSSLAFDTLYAEGQRRYVESLSTYTRQFLEKMPKPDFEALENIPPAIALEQRNHIMNSRSTVGTQTEITDYLRILFAKAGQTFCLNCNGIVKRITPQSLNEEAIKFFSNKKGVIAAPLSYSSNNKKKFYHRTLLQIYREQGFRRLLWKKKKNTLEVLDLDDLEQADFPTLKESDFNLEKLWIILDRVKFKLPLDSESESRLYDSIQQAAWVGQQKVSFFDLDTNKEKHFNLKFACTKCGTEHIQPEPHLFSFNSPLGACSHCSGFGHTLDIDEARVVPDPTQTLKNGAIDPLSKPSFSEWEKDFFRFLERHEISAGKRYKDLTAQQKKLIWNGDPKDKSFPGVLGVFEDLNRYKYKLHIRVFIRRYQTQTLCVQCKGSRLNPQALSVKIKSNDKQYTISEALDLTIDEALLWFKNISIPKEEKKIANEVFLQIEKRLRFLNEVGVGYITLSRLAKTLSGGEFQRICLATQLGNGLCGTLYVLDEPSIGLHPADTEKLIHVIDELKNQGNTIVIVEHDLDIMRHADHLIELGPGAGKRGGELIAQGTAQTLIKTKASLTGKYLDGSFTLHKPSIGRAPAKKWIKIKGCSENNLKNIRVEIPLERLTVITGVSGSGKSTLMHKTLFPALKKALHPTERSGDPIGAFEQLYGVEQINDVVLMDQSPIGRNSRSNPATYLKAWDEVRKIYASQITSMRRGYTPQYFSFNVDGGRCPVCSGEGEISLDMHFMAEVKIPCDECHGKRFKKSILDITFRGKNIADLMDTTIDEAYDLFRDHFLLAKKFLILRDVGLGYLKVGQPAPTLSGGESQRLKIASILDQRASDHILYCFDEPTTGLHLEDIKKLLLVIQDLVDSKHSVLMIEHHLDVIAHADWVIDLGPGGGELGGNVIDSCPPEVLVKNPHSTTAQMLIKNGYTFTRT